MNHLNNKYINDIPFLYALKLFHLIVNISNKHTLYKTIKFQNDQRNIYLIYYVHENPVSSSSIFKKKIIIIEGHITCFLVKKSFNIVVIYLKC